MTTNTLQLRRDALEGFLEPKFDRETVGYYSIGEDGQFKGDQSEKGSLVALKEINKMSQGLVQYEVPSHIEELSVFKGYGNYNDEFDEPNPEHLLSWIHHHKEKCQDVDIVTTHEVIDMVFTAPFLADVSTPWEIKLTRGVDGVCYLSAGADQRERYNEMNSYGQQQVFAGHAFQRYMTIKRNDRNNTPPTDHQRTLFRVNKLKVDSGVLLYQSEIQCFDKNMHPMCLKVQAEGDYDLPAPTTRLKWWKDAYLSGVSTVLSGYYEDEDNTLTRLTSFDIKHVKPKLIRNKPFDDEIGTAALCTFTDYVIDLTDDGTVASCILRFEPGSKRMCVLDLITQVPEIDHRFIAQVSATDELSSVETTPRTPKVDMETDPFRQVNGDNELSSTKTGPEGLRLRKKVNFDENLPSKNRRNSLYTEMGGEPSDDVDPDENKYAAKPPRRVRKNREGLEDNWGHIAFVFIFMGFALIVIPWLVEYLEEYLAFRLQKKEL